MTPEQVQRVAAVGNALRPDWPTASLATFIDRNLSHRTYGDLVVAMAWVASRTETDTPKLLMESGVWWRAAVTDDPSRTNRKPPRRDQECPEHPGEYAGPVCRGHAADRRAVRETTDAEQAEHRRTTAAEALADARRTLTAARAAGCKHSPVVCRDCARARDAETVESNTQPEGASA